jgi:hypothetical protein
MEFALALRQLWARRLWVLPGVILAVIIAVMATYRVGLIPPHLEKRALQYSTATTQVYVDSHFSSLGSDSANDQPLVIDSNVLAHLMASPALLRMVGQYAHIPGNEIYATGPIEPNLTRFVQEPSEGQRAYEVTGEQYPYRLEFDDDTVVPVISIYSQAPTTAEAVALANGAAHALTTYLTVLEHKSNTPLSKQVTVRQLGQPTAGVGDSGISGKLGALIFFGVLIVWCGLVLLAGRFRRTWQQSGELASLREALTTPPSQEQLSWDFGERALPEHSSLGPPEGEHASASTAGAPANGYVRHVRQISNGTPTSDRASRAATATTDHPSRSDDAEESEHPEGPTDPRRRSSESPTV